MRSKFRDALLTACRANLGTRETAHNSGPEIDEWLAYVRQKPGAAWCSAWAASMHLIASEACGTIQPYPRTAGALHVWELALPEARVPPGVPPAPGDVFVIDTGDPGGSGHVGIVELVTPDGQTVVSIEGNSSQPGYHSAEYVAKHTWRPADGRRGKLVGYIAFANLLPEDVPEALPLGVLPPSPFGAT